MTTIHELFDPDLLAEMLAERYVNVQIHPHVDGHRIWNYSQRAQFDRAWNDVTKTCRGLITDGDDNVIARPFTKFFNLGEMETIPDGEFVAQEKMDGSLGIGYPTPDGNVAIATRGSFTSDQALWATEWLHADSRRVDFVRETIAAGLTPLFEIIYPENRIVVDYGNRRDLTYLTSIDIKTGADADTVAHWPGETAASYYGLDLPTVMASQRDNAEGFVLRWPCGTRAKVKHDEYVRLHRLLTGVNARTIWDLLASGQSLDELLELVPDEFYTWVQGVVTTLTNEFAEIEATAAQTVQSLPFGASRKEQAAVIVNSPFPGIAFAMLDGKNYADIIWKAIRPAATVPFKKEES